MPAFAELILVAAIPATPDIIGLPLIIPAIQIGNVIRVATFDHFWTLGKYFFMFLFILVDLVLYSSIMSFMSFWVSIPFFSDLAWIISFKTSLIWKSSSVFLYSIILFILVSVSFKYLFSQMFNLSQSSQYALVWNVKSENILTCGIKALKTSVIITLLVFALGISLLEAPNLYLK